MIIDLSEWLTANREPPTAEEATATTPPPDPPHTPKVTLEQDAFDACRHRRMSIDGKQRTVKCGDCGIWLDPVWCLQELFYHYEHSVDWRLARIKEYEEREKERRQRRDDRLAKPRKAKAETMQQHLERAAFNEYQAKVLAARASAQRLAAEKLQHELEPEDRRKR